MKQKDIINLHGFDCGEQILSSLSPEEDYDDDHHNNSNNNMGKKEFHQSVFGCGGWLDDCGMVEYRDSYSCSCINAFILLVGLAAEKKDGCRALFSLVEAKLLSRRQELFTRESDGIHNA
jgi:hypothetical protein